MKAGQRRENKDIILHRISKHIALTGAAVKNIPDGSPHADTAYVTIKDDGG